MPVASACAALSSAAASGSSRPPFTTFENCTGSPSAEPKTPGRTANPARPGRDERLETGSLRRHGARERVEPRYMPIERQALGLDQFIYGIPLDGRRQRSGTGHGGFMCRPGRRSRGSLYNRLHRGGLPASHRGAGLAVLLFDRLRSTVEDGARKHTPLIGRKYG